MESERAYDHNCSCAPKTYQSQDPLRLKPNSGFLTVYGDFKRARVFLSSSHYMPLGIVRKEWTFRHGAVYNAQIVLDLATFGRGFSLVLSATFHIHIS